MNTTGPAHPALIPTPRPAAVPAVKPPLTPDPATDPQVARWPLPDPAPVHAGLQAQGDLLVIPWPPRTAAAHRAHALGSARPVRPAGIVLARGGGGHAHVLLAAGPDVRVAPDPYGTDRSLAVVLVPAGSTAVLAHDEHADLHLGPGVYAIRRQREANPYAATDTDQEVID